MKDELQNCSTATSEFTCSDVNSDIHLPRATRLIAIKANTVRRTKFRILHHTVIKSGSKNNNNKKWTETSIWEWTERILLRRTNRSMFDFTLAVLIFRFVFTPSVQQNNSKINLYFERRSAYDMRHVTMVEC